MVCVCCQVLIKKGYDRTRRARRRNWKLQEMARDREADNSDDERQYQDFLEDLEEDETLRKNINIFRGGWNQGEQGWNHGNKGGINLEL